MSAPTRTLDQRRRRTPFIKSVTNVMQTITSAQLLERGFRTVTLAHYNAWMIGGNAFRSYDAPEPRRFLGYFTAMAADSSVVGAQVGSRVHEGAWAATGSAAR